MKPEMFYEVLEAIDNYYDDKDIVVDCLRWLSDRDERTAYRCTKEIIEMGYCPKCGEKMETVSYREPHYELSKEIGNTIFEDYTTEICPNCDCGKE